MGDDISQRTAGGAAAGGRDGSKLDESPGMRCRVWGEERQRRLEPPHVQTGSGGRRGLSAPNTWIVWVPIAAALLGGPVGSILAIVFGWVIRQQPREITWRLGLGAKDAAGDPPPQMFNLRKACATAGIAMGLAATCFWSAVITHVAMSFERKTGDALALDVAAADAPAMLDGPLAKAAHAAQHVVPPKTTVHHEGLVVVVDIGTLVPSLSEEMAKERAEAARTGDMMVVMTTRIECPSCRFFSETLRHPLMQTALAHVRLVRIDADAFEEDLAALKIPHENLPGFFLLAPDLFPRDGIDATEWGPDEVTNAAPIIHAFVREKYAKRRRMWQRVPDNRLRL